ncbi:unnamed protein product, partial [Rotaria sp. Silwood1]
LIYARKRCRLILKLARQQQQEPQHTPAHVSSMSSPVYQPPYAHVPNSLLHQPLQQYPSLLLSPSRETLASSCVPSNSILS